MYAARIFLNPDSLTIETLGLSGQRLTMMKFAVPLVASEFVGMDVYTNEGNALQKFGPLQIDVTCNEDLHFKDISNVPERSEQDVLGFDTPGQGDPNRELE